MAVQDRHNHQNASNKISVRDSVECVIFAEPHLVTLERVGLRSDLGDELTNVRYIACKVLIVPSITKEA